MKVKNIVLIITVFCLFITSGLFATSNCFIVADLQSHEIIKQTGNGCNLPVSPCSAFKIALSLMGYDAQILKDTQTPVWPYRDSYTASLPSWKSPNNPTTWIKNSCVWYSRVLTKKLGMKRFKKYLKVMDYGNQDVSGVPGKNDGLTNAWLSSSLKISPHEQLLFLQKILSKKFPLSEQSYAMTKKILFIERLHNGWDLYGKTGSGFQRKADGSVDEDRQIRWFIGWATKDGRTIVFVKNILGKDVHAQPIKDQVKNFLSNI